MGRTIIADDTVEAYLIRLAKENKWYIGVIIGQLTSQRDYVVHLARTPDPMENTVAEEVQEDQSGDGGQPDESPKPSDRPASLADLNEKWVSTHGKQVTRMLPGGLSVVGLFAVAPPAMLKAAQVKLRQMVFSLYKQQSKMAALIPSGSEVTDRILLQMDTFTKKLTCVTYDAADVKSGSRPADWKFQSGGNKWVRLHSNITLDIPITVPRGDKVGSLLKQIQTGLSDFSSSLQNSVVTFGDSIRAGGEMLVQAEKKTKGKKPGPGSPSDTLCHDVNIYLPFAPSPPNGIVPQDSQATINMVGTSMVRAFVSSKATVADAIEAVKTDVMRGLMARCELLCEEFDVTDVTGDKSQVYDPPVRLFCRLPYSTVQVCDYVFQDEKTEEVIQRIQDLLDVDIEGLEESEKSAADECDSWESPTLSHVVDSQSEAKDQTHQKGNNFLTMAIGGLVALVAAGMSFVYANLEGEEDH